MPATQSYNALLAQQRYYEAMRQGANSMQCGSLGMGGLSQLSGLGQSNRQIPLESDITDYDLVYGKVTHRFSRIKDELQHEVDEWLKDTI